MVAAAPPNPPAVVADSGGAGQRGQIAKLAGRVGGGGSEFAASCDMRYGVRGKTLINQMEVALGILPGGTGTQRLPRLIGIRESLPLMLESRHVKPAKAVQLGICFEDLFLGFFQNSPEFAKLCFNSSQDFPDFTTSLLNGKCSETHL